MDGSVSIGETETPPETYERRKAAWERREGRWAMRDRILSWARLAVAGGTLLALWPLVQWGRGSGWWVGAGVVAFAVLAVAHDLVLGELAAARRVKEHYQWGLDRLGDRWVGEGDDGVRFAPSEHLYAADLDLFGDGSLFELLSSGRGGPGAETLAGWLLAAAPPEVVVERQARVKGLRSDLAGRESLVSSADRWENDGSTLASWARAGAPAGWFWPCLWLVGAAGSILTTVGWMALGWGPVPLVLVLAVFHLASWPVRGRLGSVHRDADRFAADLRLVAARLRVLEGEGPLGTVGARFGLGVTARQIDRLRGWLDLLESRRNPFFALLGLGVFGTEQLAFAVDRWRTRRGHELALAIRAVGEVEALYDLAAYAFEHPAYCWPDLLSGDRPTLAAVDLAHPLLPPARAVGNDVRLDEVTACLLVSGSNMSGKSTLLRAVGLAAVLAQAGAPVPAQSLALTPLAVGASIRVNDSLQEGASRFWSEINRLRAILGLAEGDFPCLFLLDELLHGTNTRERRVGAEAIVRALLGRGAIGLLTTHDLGLAEIGDETGLGVENVHLEDRLEGDELSFDYRLRPGVVTHGNALALMRKVGLDV